MDRRLHFLSGLVVGTLVSVSAPAVAQTLTVMTAGDQNMVDYVNQYLAPKFEAENPASKCWRSAPAPATPDRR